MNLLERMIMSHAEWDRVNPPPRGGSRHAKEIDELWHAWAKCQRFYIQKKCGAPEDQAFGCGERCQKAGEWARAGAAIVMSIILSCAYRRPVAVR